MATSFSRFFQFVLLMGLVYLYESGKDKPSRLTRLLFGSQGLTSPVSKDQPAAQHSSKHPEGSSEEQTSLIDGQHTALGSAEPEAGVQPAGHPTSGMVFLQHAHTGSMNSIVVANGSTDNKASNLSESGVGQGAAKREFKRSYTLGVGKVGRVAELPPNWHVGDLVVYIWHQSVAAVQPKLLWKYLKIGIPGEVLPYCRLLDA